MTDERIIAAFARLDAPVDPAPAFADGLFAALTKGVAFGTMPDPSLRGRLQSAFGLGSMPAGSRTLRYAYVVAILGLLLALAWAVLLIASSLQRPPTPLELVSRSQAAYRSPPAFSVTYRLPFGEEVRLSSDGSGTWRYEDSREDPGTYWLWDGAEHVGHFAGGTFVVGTPGQVGILGPPGPFVMEYTWGPGEVSVDDPVRHAIPCDGAVARPDDRLVVGHATEHIVCTDVGMEYWLDRETLLILRMEAGPRTPHWGGSSVKGIVEATAFSVGPEPAARFDWNGPGGAPASATPGVPRPSIQPVAPAISSGEPCILALEDPTAVAHVGIAPHELEELLPDGAALGLTEGGWTPEPWSTSYIHNAQLAAFDLPAGDACEVLELLGRILGYSGTFGNEEGRDELTESVELFLSQDGADAYVRWLAAASGSSGEGARAAPVEGVDAGVSVTGSTPDGVRSSVIFRSGVLVGTLSFQGPNGHVPPVPLAKLAAAFAARIEAATFTGRPYDVAHVMSAVVPRAGLPSAFAPLGWDLAWSGCWDHAALIGNSADPAAIAEDIAKYGVEVYCLGMYSPLGDCGPRWCPSPDPAMTSTVGIIRVATGVTVLASAADAQGYRASSLARIEATSGRTALEHFEVPGMTGAVGLRRHVKDGDLAQVDTRVVFVHGDVVAVAYVHDKTEADHRDQVVEMAKALDARLDEVLEDSRP